MEKNYKSPNIRQLALDLLLGWEAGEKYANLSLNAPALAGLNNEELGQLTALFYTTVERKITYDYLISALSGRGIDKISPKAKNILRLGLCQILHMDKIPDFASVNETVKLSGSKSEAGFVNAVLRRAVREKESLPYPKREKNAARYLSVMYSVPLVTVKLFIKLFGEDAAEKMLALSLEESPLSITVNTGVISREALMEKLSSLGATPSKYTDNGLVLKEKISPKSIKGFNEGEFFVQDEASRVAISALKIEKGMCVLDLCAAPGGKSFAAAIKAEKGGLVYSADIHESKLSLIEGGAKRLRLENIKVMANDASVLNPDFIGKFDRVICDVPCSGFGVMSKKPDLRYKDLQSVGELPPLQYEILSVAAKYLKCGGALLYSTCTVNPEENDFVTDKFIEENPEFSYEGFTVGELSAPTGKITLLPHVHGTDGFYISIMRKNND